MLFLPPSTECKRLGPALRALPPSPLPCLSPHRLSPSFPTAATEPERLPPGTRLPRPGAPGAPAARPGPAGASRSPRDEPPPPPRPEAAAGSGSCPAGGCAGGGAPGEGPGTPALRLAEPPPSARAPAVQTRAMKPVVQQSLAPWGPTPLHESRRGTPHHTHTPKAKPLNQEVACVRSTLCVGSSAL